MKHEPRRRWRICVVALLVAALVAACTAAGEVVDPITPTTSAPDDAPASAAAKAPGIEASGEVTVSGFSLAVEGATVSAPGGVADAGTPVTVRLLDPDLELEDTTHLSKVDVVLGDGLQPEAPITILFDIEEPSSGSLDYVVMRGESDGKGYTEVEHQEEAGVIRVETTHLSFFDLFSFNPGAILDALLLEMQIMLGLQYPQPACVDGSYGEGGGLEDYLLSLEGPGLGAVWICADGTPHQELEVRIHSNSPNAWQVRSSTHTLDPVVLPDLDLGAILATAAYMRYESPTASTLLTPGGAIRLRTPDEMVPVRYEATASLEWSLVALVVGSALEFASKGSPGTLVSLDRAVTLDQVADCLTGTLDYSVRLEDEFALGPTVSSSLSCLELIAEHVFGLQDRRFFLKLTIVSKLIILNQGAFAAAVALGPNNFTVGLSPLHGTGDTPPSVPVDGDLTGTWVGDVDQPGSGAYSVRVELTRDGDEYAGVVAYPELGCSGVWTQAEESDAMTIFTETITQGGGCVHTLPIQITPLPDGTLSYFADYSSGATANLHRSTSEQAAWPTERNDTVPGLSLWLGASAAGPDPIDFPLWVACDSTSTWCLLGGVTRHTLIQTEPRFGVVGRLDPFASDALDALVQQGLDPDAAEQVLGTPGDGGGGGGW